MELDDLSDEYKTIAGYDILKRRRIANSWNPDQERILKIWAEKASGWAWLHDKASRRYHSITSKIMYPSIVLSTVSGGIGFSMYSETSRQTTRFMTILIGSMNLVAAFLSSLQKFIRSTEKAEVHRHTHKLFSSYCRDIVMELALKPSDRRDCIEFCQVCRDQYTKLVADSPEIPDPIITEFKKKFANAKHVPEIANGLVHFHDFKSTPEGLEWERRRSRDILREIHMYPPTPGSNRNRQIPSLAVLAESQESLVSSNGYEKESL